MTEADILTETVRVPEDEIRDIIGVSRTVQMIERNRDALANSAETGTPGSAYVAFARVLPDKWRVVGYDAHLVGGLFHIDPITTPPCIDTDENQEVIPTMTYLDIEDAFINEIAVSVARIPRHIMFVHPDPNGIPAPPGFPQALARAQRGIEDTPVWM